MPKRLPKPMTELEVNSLITHMSATADILSLDDNWLAGQLVATAHMRGREVAEATVREAVRGWKDDELRAHRWQHRLPIVREVTHGA